MTRAVIGVRDPFNQKLEEFRESAVHEVASTVHPHSVGCQRLGHVLLLAQWQEAIVGRSILDDTKGWVNILADFVPLPWPREVPRLALTNIPKISVVC
eukprot:CAMPEP_0119421846 /NCGR_PEP_ID=MMETSP1335-20130426/26833_1 /TAXON_ID=259385 /ORGANISM="Chrysoculter rhomboideus, Strain RCC1486" /LENGTH=97 /DNA_ID=CAMNT_0007447267 /DNA_START=38 /DNA_END=331 /DNA_ORIENTATION=-